MARLVPARCPTCGAGLSVAPGAEWVTCGYCHTSSFVQREKTAAPSLPQGAAVIQVREPPRSRAPVWLFLASVVLGIGGIAAFRVSSGSGFGRGVLIGSQFLTDLNGDGTDDVVIHSLHVGDSDFCIAAIDGATGSTLWESEELLKSGQDELVAAIPGGVLVLVGGTGVALDGRTGHVRHRVSLPEKADVVCSAGQSFTVLGRDDQFYELEATTGAPRVVGKLAERHADAFTPPCTPVASDHWSAHGGAIRSAASVDLAEPKPMSVDRVLQGVGETVELMLGARVHGSAVPMVGGRTAGRVVWTSEVPAANPLNAQEGAPLAATVAGGRAIVAYEHDSRESVSVTAFSLADGRRLWDVELPKRGTGAAAALAANARFAYVWLGHGPSIAFHRLNATDGHLDWTL